MFQAVPPALVTGIVLVLVAVAAVIMLSLALERAEADMVADLGEDTSGYSLGSRGASDRMHAAIAHSAAREARVLGHSYTLLDEDGDVDTLPPLTQAQEKMLRQIDLVELQTVTFERWSDLEAKFRKPPTCPAFPVALVGRGVTIPQAHNPEVLA